jgi:hypothetical protein
MSSSPPPATAKGLHVVILGLGPSLNQYLNLARQLGGRSALGDQVWAINALGDVVACDRIFHMDDVRIQEIRAAALPQSNIARMLGWMKTHPGPIYTSRLHPDYPGLVEFPLQDVINAAGHAYFNSTAAYAVALAIAEGAATVSLFGIDYTYANAHHAEKGRACVEFWLGVAHERGIAINVSEGSSLLDTCEGLSLYGYGAMGSRDVRIHDAPAGRNGEVSARVEFVERPVLPAAAEIEAAYDHTNHPSPLVGGKIVLPNVP